MNLAVKEDSLKENWFCFIQIQASTEWNRMEWNRIRMS